MSYSRSAQKFLKKINLLQKFHLSHWYTVDRPILKCDYIRYTPPSLKALTGD